jgi:hypothetical protein
MRERPALNLLLVALAAAPLALVIGDFVLAQGNSALRRDIDSRQQAIAEGARLAQVNQALIRQIALAAIKARDAKLRDLLSRNGITIRPAPTPSEDGKGE